MLRFGSLLVAGFLCGCALDFDGLTLDGAGGGATTTTTSTTTTASSMMTTTSTVTSASGGGGEGGGSSSTTGGCDVCIPPAPVGFAGPLLVAAGLGGDPCGGPGGDVGGRARAPLQPACACTYDSAAPCALPNLNVFSTDTCTGGMSTSVPMSLTCTAIGAPFGVLAADGNPIMLNGGGACAADLPPSPKYDMPVTVCPALSVGAPCAEGSCASLAAGDRACVKAPDPSCAAAGPYSDPVTVHSATLACGSCPAPTFNCSAKAGLFMTSNCSDFGVSAQLGSAFVCEAMTGVDPSTYAKVIPNDPALFSDPCGGEAVSTVTSDIPTYLCCLP